MRETVTLSLFFFVWVAINIAASLASISNYDRAHEIHNHTVSLSP